MPGIREMEAAEVVAEIAKTADFLVGSGGGVTFSGGEPLCQPDFILEIISRLCSSSPNSDPPSLSFAIETCGYAQEADYRRVVSRMDVVLQDVKFPDLEGYRKWTGVDAAPIFSNLKWLMGSGIPFVARMPVIPGVNDSAAGKEAIAELLAGSKNLLYVELLPYNRLAGAKYAKLGRAYSPGFDETAAPDLGTAAFARNGICARAASQAFG